MRRSSNAVSLANYYRLAAKTDAAAAADDDDDDGDV